MRCERVTLLDGTTGRRGLYLLPMGLATHHVHVWKSLLERAGFTPADIPNEWDAFWAFWCDQVQPAVRRATGREDIWGIGLPMSPISVDTSNGIWQFIDAYEADYVTRDGRLVIDDPEIRRRLIEAVDRYTAIYRKGCTPPDSVAWDGYGNNAQFLAQTDRDDAEPDALDPQCTQTRAARGLLRKCHDDRLARRRLRPAARHRDLRQSRRGLQGRRTHRDRKGVRALPDVEGWLAHYLNFAGERMLPPMPKLLDAPFWLDPGDPHRMRSAMQLLTQPRSYDYVAASGDWRYAKSLPWSEVGGDPWPEAVHRVAADGISPEQAVDEAIARIKQILSE